MTEVMLGDTDRAHGLRYVALRYFNVAGADPLGRTGQASSEARHLIKVACQAALRIRDRVDIYGADYPTPDGTGVRDYIHVVDLARCHLAALAYLRSGGGSLVLNCGYGHGYSVLEVIEAVRRIAPCTFETRVVDRRPGDPPILVADTARIGKTLDWRPRFDDLGLIVGDALAWEESLASRLSRPAGVVR
jgi:UDP-glucose 4-epimerase